MKKLIASILAAAAIAGATTPAFAAWGNTDSKECKIFARSEGTAQFTDFNGIRFRLQLDGDFARMTQMSGSGAGQTTPLVFLGRDRDGDRVFANGDGFQVIVFSDREGDVAMIIIREPGKPMLRLFAECR